MASPQDISIAFAGTYRRTGDRFVREDSEKTIYRGLAWVWVVDRLVVAESDQRLIKGYSGGTLAPMREGILFAALRRGDRTPFAAEPELLDKLTTERDELGRSLLYRAAELGDQEAVGLFLANGVPADLRNAPPFERTALAAAIQSSRLNVVDQLLAAGADPNLPDAFGARPLHIAGESSGAYRRLIRRLLKAGADPDLTNKAGETPRARLERAHARGFLPILDEEIAAARRNAVDKDTL